MDLSELEDKVQLFRYRLHEQTEELGSLRRQVANHSLRTNSDMLLLLDEDIASYCSKIELYNEVLTSTFKNTFAPYVNDLQPAQHWNVELLEGADYEFADGLAPWEFILKCKNYTKALNDLDNSLCKYMKFNAPKPYRTYPRRGVLCLYKRQRRLYRGMCLGMSSAGRLTMAAVDANERHELDLSQVYEIPDSMLRLPPQIIRCCLYTNPYIKFLWSGYFVENFIRVMRQYSFTIAVERMQSQKLPPVYLLESLTACNVSGEIYNIKNWIENVITPRVLEYKCAIAEELFEEGSIDSHIWDIEPNLDGMIHDDPASVENPIHDAVPEIAPVQVEEQLPENVEVEVSLTHGLVDEEAYEEENLAEEYTEEKYSIEQSVLEVDAHECYPVEEFTTQETSCAQNLFAQETAENCGTVRHPSRYGRHTVEQVSAQESPAIDVSPQKSNRKISAQNLSAVNVSAWKSPDEKAFALESSDGKVSAHKSPDRKVQESSVGKLAVTEKLAVQPSIDPFLLNRDPNNLYTYSVSLPFDAWENNRDLDVLEGSDEEQQVAEILHDAANIGPTYRDEVLFCLEYKNTGTCTRFNCQKEHIYPISPHSVGSVYTYIRTERLLELPEKGSFIHIRPINIVNAFTFYAILVGLDNPNEPDLELIHQRMQNEAETSRYERLDLLPSLGELVLAYGQLKFWYRARIIDVGECKAKVFSLDFGTEEAVPLNRLRKINYDLLFLPPQAVRCYFHGIIPKKNNDPTVKEYLTRHILNRVLEAEVKLAFNDMILEQRVVELSKENHFLKAQLAAIKDKYGISGEAVVNVEQVMATLPTNDQVLSITKRAKINNNINPPIIFQPNSVPIPTPVIHKANPSPPLALNVYPEDQYSEERYPFPFPPVLPPLNPPVLEAASNSVLNLSRRGNNNVVNVGVTTPVDMVSLPHKLRHKSHLGDKDVAATALLSLHNIKQEARASPPWDTEGSSDERDSGISLGAEWIMPATTLPEQPSTSPLEEPIESEDNLDDTHLKSEVARLASEVATLKSMLTRKKTAAININ